MVDDLRLVPAALAAWAVCAVGVGLGVARLGLGGAAAVAVVALVLAVVSRRRWVRGGMATGWLALAAAAAALASCTAQVHLSDQGALTWLAAERATVTLVGTARSEAVPVAGFGDEPRWRTVLAVEHVTGRGRDGGAAAGVLVLGGSEWAGLPYGAQVTARGRLGPTDPGDALRAVLTASGMDLLAPPGPVDRAVASVRRALLAVTNALPPDARGLVPGAAIGDTSRVPADLDQAMRDVSLTHITAVSGSHFAVLSMTVLALTALLRLPRWARAATTGAVLAGFVLLVHPEPSVVRAAVMGALGVAGMLLGRPSRAIPALAAAVVVLLVLDPWLARTYGFVLSVLATGAIVLLAPPLARFLGRAVPRWLAVAIAVPAAAQAVCAPVLVLLNPGVSLYAVPANVLVAPALVPATVLGVLAAVLAPWLPGAATVVAQGAAAATWWIAAVARTAAGLPGARQEWPGGPGGALGLAVASAALLALVLAGHRALRRGRVVTALGLLLVLLPAAPLGVGTALRQPWPADWRAVLCDVGQGDALVVRSGPGSAVVIDVGPDGEAADACLDGLGVERIDLLVLTHFHADHVGGLEAALDGREVAGALVGPLSQPAGQYARAVAALEEAGIGVQVGHAPASGEAGQVQWTVLSPEARAAPAATGGGIGASGTEINDSSLVLLLQEPGLTLVALGDAEEAAQERLAARLPGRAMAADVVKVAHHGSARQSPALARLLRPAVALISAGVDNDYGHPAPSTIALYRDIGALVLSTSQCGTIAVGSADGDASALRVSARCLGRSRD